MAHQPPLLLPGQWYLAWCPCGWYADWPIGGPERDIRVSERQAEGHDYYAHMPKTWRMGPDEDPNDRFRAMRLSGRAMLMLLYLSPGEGITSSQMKKNLDIQKRWGKLTGAE